MRVWRLAWWRGNSTIPSGRSSTSVSGVWPGHSKWSPVPRLNQAELGDSVVPADLFEALAYIYIVFK